MNDAHFLHWQYVPEQFDGSRVIVNLTEGGLLEARGPWPQASVGPAGELYVRGDHNTGPLKIIAPGEWRDVLVLRVPEEAADAA